MDGKRKPTQAKMRTRQLDRSWEEARDDVEHSVFDDLSADVIALRKILWSHKPFAAMLPLYPLGVLACVSGCSPGIAFVINMFGYVPIAWFIGKATRDLSTTVCPGALGILIVLSTNIAEILLLIVGLISRDFSLLQYALVGSMIYQLLFIAGASLLVECYFFKGRYPPRLHQTSSDYSSAFFGTIAFVSPSLYTHLPRNYMQNHCFAMASVLWWICVILLLSVVWNFMQQLRLPCIPALDVSLNQDEESGQKIYKSDLSFTGAICLLVLSVIASVLSFGFMINNIHGTDRAFHVSVRFVGMVMLPVVSNLPVLNIAIVYALENQMELCLGLVSDTFVRKMMLVMPAMFLIGASFGHEMVFYLCRLDCLILPFAVLCAYRLLNSKASRLVRGAEGIVSVTFYALLAMYSAFDTAHPESLRKRCSSPFRGYWT